MHWDGANVRKLHIVFHLLPKKQNSYRKSSKVQNFFFEYITDFMGGGQRMLEIMK